MKKTWVKWKLIAKKVVGIQAAILLTVIYVFFILPLGFILQKFFPRKLEGQNIVYRNNSFWIKRAKVKYDVKWARRQ